jgi:hypothetical protein
MSEFCASVKRVYNIILDMGKNNFLVKLANKLPIFHRYLQAYGDETCLLNMGFFKEVKIFQEERDDVKNDEHGCSMKSVTDRKKNGGGSNLNGDIIDEYTDINRCTEHKCKIIIPILTIDHNMMKICTK